MFGFFPGIPGIFVECVDDVFDQLVAHDVAFVELHDADPPTPRRISIERVSPLSLFFGRSICVTSPVTINLALRPMRVRNILICDRVVFCASSRMTNALSSVRPRM